MIFMSVFRIYFIQSITHISSKYIVVKIDMLENIDSFSCTLYKCAKQNYMQHEMKFNMKFNVR